MKKTFALALAAASLLAFAACGDDHEKQPEQAAKSIFWKIDGTTLAQTPILADCGIKDPYGISVFGSRIYITTHSNYSANGDVYCFNMGGVRQWKSEAGMLPSKVEPCGDVNQTAYVLNEGVWGNNEASLSTVNCTNGSIANNVFRTANSRSLGDVAQDIVVYGQKAYVAVTFSNSVEVLDTRSNVATHIDLALASPSVKNPRKIAVYGGKIYVTCYDPCSVVRIDTATLAVEAVCALGGYHPEGIAEAGGKLLIASSHISDEHSNYTYDDHLYVVNISTFTVERTVAVGTNPIVVKALDGNRVVVNYIGNYADIPAGTAIVDVNNGSVTPLGKALYNFDICDGAVYGYESTY